MSNQTQPVQDIKVFEGKTYRRMREDEFKSKVQFGKKFLLDIVDINSDWYGDSKLSEHKTRVITIDVADFNDGTITEIIDGESQYYWYFMSDLMIEVENNPTEFDSPPSIDNQKVVQVNNNPLVNTNRHVHADLMIAYANNKDLKFQYKVYNHDDWEDTPCPAWHSNYQYRIKPEPKTETRYLVAYKTVTGESMISYGYFTEAKRDSVILPWTAKEFEVEED